MKNKTVVITGAANGLGKALASEFSNRGYDLALIDIDFTGLENVQRQLKATDNTVTIYQADISQEENVIRVQQEIIRDHHGVNILINNAAISISREFENVGLEDFQNLFSINFWGTIYCSRYFLSNLKLENNSRLVNIISYFALMGFPGKTTYGSSKSAVMGFSNALKTELAETTVKVCLVIPPPLDTNIVKNSIHIDETKKQKEAAFLQKHGMPVSKVAKRMADKIESGKFRIVVGTMMFWVDLFSRLFPTSIHKFIGKKKKKFGFV